MKASEIKKELIGILLSDGYIDLNNRFSVYNKNEEFAQHVHDTLSSLTRVSSRIRTRLDKRFDTTGYSVETKTHPYFKVLRGKFYSTGRKELNSWIVDRLDARALAFVWMCDGYLEHSKNRKLDKIQNIGWFCLESFPKEELELFQNRLRHFGVESSLVRKPWGFGYRVRIGGYNLQRFISLIYSFILPCFLYKTVLFYRGKEHVLDLPSAEQYIKPYGCVEDIVRHSSKEEKTN